MKVTSAYLYAIAPGASDVMITGILAACDGGMLSKYNIVSDQQIAMFFGQIAEETGGFTRLEESLTYTSTARLMQVWPSRFPTPEIALPYVRNPVGLAAIVYNGRMGNRPGSQDGWNYRGSGCLQDTGEEAFAAVEKATGQPVLMNPSLLRSFPLAFESACIFWNNNRLNQYADANDIVTLTRVLNGGLTNLADRRLYTDRALRATVTPGTQTSPMVNALRKGDAGDAVRDWQAILVAQGYYAGGKLDGDFGDATDDATRHFQRDHGLQDDGVVGPATLRAGRLAVPSPVDPHTNPVAGPLAPAVPSPVPAPAMPVTGSAGGLAAIIGGLISAIIKALGRR